jgi:hypothetical protein
LPAPSGSDYPPPSVPPQPAPTHDHYAQPAAASYGDQYGQPAAANYGDQYGQPAYGQYSVDPPNSAPPGPAPTLQVPPVSGPPTSIPPYGTPQSAPPYPMPQSAPPQMGAPVLLGPPGPQPTAKRGAAVPVLSGLTVLFLIVAGVFVGLYIDKSGKLSAEQKTVANQKTTIADNTSEIDRLNRDLKTKTDLLTETEQKLRGSQSLADKTKQERDVVGKCLTLLTEALVALDRNDRTTAQAKINEMKAPCDEADRILGLG